MKRIVGIIFALPFLAAIAIQARAATLTVAISNFAFTPAEITVNPGDTVTWVNQDLTSHTATSGPPGAPDGVFNSGALGQGQSFSHTFAAAGRFPYYCGFHTFMTGSVTVQGAQAPTVEITSPTNNATFSAPGNITIEAAATATGSTITAVEFFDGTTSLGTDAEAPFNVNASLGAGAHSLTAKAADSAGASTVSSVVTVTVAGGGTPIDDPIPAKIPKGTLTIELKPIASGLVSPLGLAVPDDGSGRAFLYDQAGFIYVMTNDARVETPMLDVSARLVKLNGGYDERGLLGVAPHPDFAHHPLVYTYTSEPNGPMADFMIMYDGGQTNDHQSVIAEWRIDPANPNRLDPASRREVLRIDKPQSNHNGGTMRFGPDGFLYFSVGDGGNADDQGNGHSPGGNAQDRMKILGKVVRIDVDGRNSANGQYGVPSDNPFTGESTVLPEIYAYGLRNPYSFSFDRLTGELWLGDVGQNSVEEVDKIIRGGNFGWSIKEGSFYFDANGTNNGFVTSQPVREVPADLIDPVAQFDHDEGHAVIGGAVYHGSAVPSLNNRYIFGDWGDFQNPSGRLFYLEGNEVKEFKIGASDRPLGLWLKGFGQDGAGELYVMGATNLGPAGTSGVVWKIVAPAHAPAANSYLQHNLVSDLPGVADIVDTNLVNPWGISFSATSFFWTADNGTGLSTLYNSTGAVQSIVVRIPAPAGQTEPSSPTGTIFNNSTNFVLGTNASRFLFVTEQGTLAAWNGGADATIMADNSSSNAIYKGLAAGMSRGSNYLYAADFHNGRIDVFDGMFKPAVLPGNFADPSLPPGFAPFNIQSIGGNLFVTYARQDDEGEDDVPGNGNGFVNVFSMDGILLRRFASGGVLNSPWGVTLAPAEFGLFGGAILIGNFGDGAINAFDPETGAPLGRLNDQKGSPLLNLGLWDLKFGNGANGGKTNVLYFTAGIPGDGAVEDHGLLGSISFAPGFLVTGIERSGNTLTLTWSGGTPPYVIQTKANLNDPAWTDVKTVSETTADMTISGDTGFFRVSASGQ